MNIIISGYGRMGKEIEKAALEIGHSIVAKIDNSSDWEKLKDKKVDADVVIDFSFPDVAIDNIKRCFTLGIPIVTGTTGWYDKLGDVKDTCLQENGTIFYAPNFSIGVNLFFRVNNKLAKIMSSFESYRVSIKEIHHIHKLDAPSGTAIKVAEDIIENHKGLEKWVNRPESGTGVMPVESIREGDTAGTHIVKYESSSDLIELKHEAKNRSGFVKGAVIAAEWVKDKQGIFTMDDLLNEML